jgi:SanA protein
VLSRLVKMLVKLLFISLATILLLLLTSRLITAIFARSRTASLETIDPVPVILVFGAGLKWDGSPTVILQDRVRTAADLYFAGKASVLLMSGDNRFVDYNEPAAMRNYALTLGVPDEAIVLDYAGRRTYDTCYRARVIFGLKEVILVTQGYHLPRALYTCNLLGVEAKGVPADQRKYRQMSLAYWQLREIFATLVALWDVHISQPLPVLGDPEPLFITNQATEQNGGNL